MTGAAARTKASKSRFTLISFCICNPIDDDVGVIRHYPDQYRFTGLCLGAWAPLVVCGRLRFARAHGDVAGRHKHTGGKTAGATGGGGGPRPPPGRAARPAPTPH